MSRKKKVLSQAGGIWSSRWVKPWIGLLSKVTNVSTTCAVVIFRAKVSCDTLITWWYYMIKHTLTLKMLPQRLSKHPSLSTKVLFRIYSPRWSYSTHLRKDSWVQTFHCLKIMYSWTSIIRTFSLVPIWSWIIIQQRTSGTPIFGPPNNLWKFCLTIKCRFLNLISFVLH